MSGLRDRTPLVESDQTGPEGVKIVTFRMYDSLGSQRPFDPTNHGEETREVNLDSQPQELITLWTDVPTIGSGTTEAPSHFVEIRIKGGMSGLVGLSRSYLSVLSLKKSLPCETFGRPYPLPPDLFTFYRMGATVTFCLSVSSHCRSYDLTLRVLNIRVEVVLCSTEVGTLFLMLPVYTGRTEVGPSRSP